MKTYLFKKSFKIFSTLLFCGIFIAAGLAWFLEFRGGQKVEVAQIDPIFAEPFDYPPSADSGGDNVSGYAWSSNIGWISFNATDCDQNNNGVWDSTVAGCPDPSDDFFDWGVRVDPETGDFSGYAWSSNIGWIWFAPDAGYPALPDHGARYEYDNNAAVPEKIVTGWARICSMADNPDTCSGGNLKGWIKMSKHISDMGADYGMRISMVDDSVSGWIWSGETDGSGIGWISMNCEDMVCVDEGTGLILDVGYDGSCSSGEPRSTCLVCSSDNHIVCDPTTQSPGDLCDGGSGTCQENDYAVTAQVNFPPTADALVNDIYDLDGVEQLWVCEEDHSVKTAFPSWDFDDVNPFSDQSRFVLNFYDDHGEFMSDGTTYLSVDINSNADSYQINDLDYDTQYWWKLDVWDEYDRQSLATAEGDFTTPEHEAPRPYFSWFIPDPSQEEEVMFTSSSTCYTQGFDTPYLCDSSNPPITEYLWNVVNDFCTDPDANIDNDIASTTILEFICSGPNSRVVLTLTDGDFACSTSTADGQINVKNKLPTWIEAK